MVKSNYETTRQTSILRLIQSVNMGIGAIYRAFTLNLAYGFPFLNRGEEQKGKTEILGKPGTHDMDVSGAMISTARRFYKANHLYHKCTGFS